jgi:hypothetical protein
MPELLDRMPRWLVALAAACILAVAVLVVWRTVFVSPLWAGPAKKVNPGDYDFMAEVNRKRAAEAGGATGLAPGEGAPGAPYHQGNLVPAPTAARQGN